MTPESASAIQILPYLVFLAAYVILCASSELTRNKWFHFAALTLALLFAGFRNALSPDMERYRFYYEHYRAGDYTKLIEPSFVLISAVLSNLGLDYHALFFFYTLVTLGFVFAAVNNLTTYTKTSTLLYILIPHLFLGLFIEMRQECAVAVVFYAMSLLYKEDLNFRTAKVVFFAALSVAFHYSAAGYWLVFFLCLRLLRKEFSFTTYVVSLVGTLLLPSWVVIYAAYAIFYPVLPPDYRLHLDDLRSLGQQASGAHSLLSIAIYNSLAIIFVLTRKSMQRPPETLRRFVNIFFLGVLFLNLTRAYGDVARFADYFIIYEIVLLPEVLYRTGKLYLRPTVVYFVLFLYCLHFVHGLYYLNEETDTYIFLQYKNALLSGL